MDKIEKFIHFGCWNKGHCDMSKTVNQSSLTQVMKKLNEFSTNELTKPDFILVAGDNYYPEKRNDKQMGKIKKLYIENLESGFDCLPKNIESNVILGNHDLENGVYLESDNVSNKPNDCNIIDSEINFSERNSNIKLKLFNSKTISNGKTLILMVDSTIYDNESNDFLECYKKILKKTIEIDDVSLNSLTINDIKNLQKVFVESEIDKNIDNVKNVIIVAHHPITCYKYKKVVKKIETKTDLQEIQEIQEEKKQDDIDNLQNEEVIVDKYTQIQAVQNDITDNEAIFGGSNGDIQENDEGKKVIEQTEHKIFLVDTPGFGLTNLLYNSIYNKLNNRVNYYYLCADLHLYQYGTIFIKPDTIEDDNLSMTIKQYIVGTGGTDMDENPFKYNTNTVQNSIIFEPIDESISENYIVKYIVTEDYMRNVSSTTHGFLECHILNDEELKFRFIASDDSIKIEPEFIDYFEEYMEKNKSSQPPSPSLPPSSSSSTNETEKTFIDQIKTIFSSEEEKQEGGKKNKLKHKTKRNVKKNNKKKHLTKKIKNKSIKKQIRRYYMSRKIKNIRNKYKSTKKTKKNNKRIIKE